MHHASHASRGRQVPVGWISLLEILLLAPLSAMLVLGVLPSAFGIESECTTGQGIVRTAGDTYVASFVVLGAIGWLGVILGVMFANISESRRAAVLLPLAWSGALVLASLAVAAAIGPASCPA